MKVEPYCARGVCVPLFATYSCSSSVEAIYGPVQSRTWAPSFHAAFNSTHQGLKAKSPTVWRSR